MGSLELSACATISIEFPTKSARVLISGVKITYACAVLHIKVDNLILHAHTAPWRARGKQLTIPYD